MSVESLLFETLRDLVSDRVYPDITPQGITALPRITYQQVGGQGLNFLEAAPVGKKNGRFQINVWGATRLQVAELSRQVEDALKAETLLYTTVLAAPIATYETDTKLFGTMQDFSFWWSSALGLGPDEEDNDMAITLGSFGEEMNLEIRQGATFGPFLFAMANPDGSPVNLTGCTIQGQIRKTPESVAKTALDVTITAPTLGQYQFGLTAAKTTAMSAGARITSPESQNVWDLELVDSTGLVTPLYYGLALVFREVTRP